MIDTFEFSGIDIASFANKKLAMIEKINVSPDRVSIEEINALLAEDEKFSGDQNIGIFCEFLV